MTFARLLGAVLLLLVLLDSNRIAQWMASPSISATQHVETYLHWFMTAKPAGAACYARQGVHCCSLSSAHLPDCVLSCRAAGIKLHPQTCWLFGHAGLLLAQQNSKLLLAASSLLAPALLGKLWKCTRHKKARAVVHLEVSHLSNIHCAPFPVLQRAWRLP